MNDMIKEKAARCSFVQIPRLRYANVNGYVSASRRSRDLWHFSQVHFVPNIYIQITTLRRDSHGPKNIIALGCFRFSFRHEA